MKISTRGRYAIRALIEIAKRGPDSLLTVKEISEAQNISMTYLEHLMIKLKKAGLITSQRGTKGGFLLKKSPDEITLYDIIYAVEGPVFLSKCLKSNVKNDCKFTDECYLKGLYTRISRSIEEIFKQITIEQVLGESSHGE